MSTIQATVSIAGMLLALINLFIISVLRPKDARVKPGYLAAAAAYLIALPVMYDADPAMSAPDTLHAAAYAIMALIAVLSVILIIRRSRGK